jgi:DNA-binding MarR family transcriptional regulator
MTGETTRRDTVCEVWQMMGDLVLHNERRREVTEEIGLSFGKVRVLRRIVDRPLPMGELAALLSVDPPNLTTLIDGLERAGLVRRQAHPTDRRVQLVVDTPAGAKIARRAEAILDRPPVGLTELAPADLASLARILSKIRSDEANRSDD